MSTSLGFNLMEKSLKVNIVAKDQRVFLEADTTFVVGGFSPKPHALFGPISLMTLTALQQKHLKHHLCPFRS